MLAWGNAIVRTIVKDVASYVRNITATLHLDGDVRTTSKKITTLPHTDPNLRSTHLVEYGHLITKEKLRKNDTLLNFVNTVSEKRHLAMVADAGIAELNIGDVIQFERKGYFRLDVVGFIKIRQEDK